MTEDNEDKAPKSLDSGQDEPGDKRPVGGTADPSVDDAQGARGGKQEPEAGQASGKPTDSAEADHRPWGVFQQFLGNVYAEQGQFGMVTATAPAPRTTGRLDEAEIAKIVRTYARPASYEEAAAALEEERVVIIAGQPGSGRRAGAIDLLSFARSPGKPLVGLSPASTVAQLAERTFDRGVGYVISDMFDENLVPDLADYHWRSVCSTIRRSMAHLVVTTSTDSRMAKSGVVRHVSWQRPAAADALRAHLGAVAVDDEILDQVSEALGSDYLLAPIGEIARRIAAKKDFNDILTGLQDSDRLAVAKWLDEVDAEIPAVLEVAALTFVDGVAERVFEAELRQLKARISEFAPEIDTTDEKVRAEIDLRFRQRRKGRADNPLLTVRQVPVAGGSGALAVRHVEFKAATYREHVLSELWSRFDAEFWDAVRRWLHGIAADGDPYLINSVAVGLALLGLVAPDEVIYAYLNPWTDEAADWSEQTTAVYVIWQMSMHGDLAPLALQIAIQWAGQGSSTQRTAASLAFSGELGAQFPTEAVKRLTQLANQGEPQGHALLFATLAEQGTDAVVVLHEMRRRMNAETGRPSADLISDAIVDLLSIRDPRSGRPSVALFLIKNPLRASDVAPLWTRVLCLRPWRRRAVIALRDALGAIEHGRANAEELARSLGSAIGRNLPPDERIALRAELISLVWADAVEPDDEDEESPRGSAGKQKPARRHVSESLLEIFLVACAAPPPREIRRCDDQLSDH